MGGGGGGWVKTDVPKKKLHQFTLNPKKNFSATSREEKNRDRKGAKLLAKVRENINRFPPLNHNLQTSHEHM